MQRNVYLALLLTTLSGLSTGLGGVVILALGTPSMTKLGHMLSFSAGVMIYISFMDLLVGSAEVVGFPTANLAFFAGGALFMAIVGLVPEPDVSKFVNRGTNAGSQETKGSTGAKKGDGGALSKAADSPKENSNRAPVAASQSDIKSLLTLGMVTAFGISLHNFPEGIAVCLSCLARGPAVGLPLTLAIAAHNIPEGMAVAAPIYSATGSKWLAIKYSLLSGLCEPLGALLVAALIGPFMTTWLVQILLAGVGGIMVFMSFKELVPTTLRYIDPELASYSFLAGMVTIFLTVYYLRETLGA